MVRFFLLTSVAISLVLSTASYGLQLAELEKETAKDLLLFFEEEELLAATGTPKTIRTAPAVATVITAREIEEMGAATLDEVLETVPGLHVVPSSVSYFTSVWSIRGIQLSLNPQVLLLINGVPFTNTYTGDRTQTFKMLTKKISRIEVIRGPGSAVHGADAFAGVINVITKGGEEIKGSEAGIRAGSFETFGSWMQHGGAYNGWDIALTIEGWTTNGDPGRIVSRDRLGSGSPSNTPAELDAWHDMVDLTLGLKKDEWAINVLGSLQDDYAGVGAIETITKGDADTETLLTDITYTKKEVAEGLDISLRLHYIYMYNDIFLHIFPRTFRNQLGNPITWNREGGIEATTFYKGIDDHRFRLSIGGRNIDVDIKQYKNWGAGPIPVQFGPMVNITGTDYDFMLPHNRNIWYLSLQDEWRFTRDWELTAGIRYDEYSDVGNTTNPRIALVWEARPDLTTKLLYGRAFRAPSFAELHARNNVSATGNPDLVPEEIESLELAFDYRPAQKLETKLSLFTYKAENLIEFVLPTPRTARNNAEQEGHGFEVELDWLTADTLRIRSNFAYQRSKNKTLDAIVPDAPEMQFYISPHWTFRPDWSLNGQMFWVAGRHRHPDDPREDIEDYTTFNLTLRRKNITSNLDAAIGIRNVFDEDIREPSPYDPDAPLGAYIPDDYPMDGRAFWAEVRYNF